jgi:pimeloyl-ACP methyl ester carboxylesterase
MSGSGDARAPWATKEPTMTFSRTAVPRQTFVSDGVRLSFVDVRPDAGHGAPILLIHGFASSIDYNWLNVGWFEPLLGAGFRVIAIDNRGHGASEKLYDIERYSPSILADDACRLLDYLNITRADIMGYSMGGRTLAVLAATNPQRVRSAIFGGVGINLTHNLPGTGPIALALEAPSLDDVTNPAARTFRIFADQTKSDRRALAACIRGIRVAIPLETVARIRCPALVAVGTKDVIAGSGAELAALIPGARYLEIVDRDHMLAVGDKVYKAGVLAFLAERP